MIHAREHDNENLLSVGKIGIFIASNFSSHFVDLNLLEHSIPRKHLLIRIFSMICKKSSYGFTSNQMSA